MGGGGTPQTTTQNINQTTQLPQWYQDYLNNVMGRAVTQADSSSGMQTVQKPTLDASGNPTYDQNGKPIMHSEQAPILGADGKPVGPSLPPVQQIAPLTADQNAAFQKIRDIQGGATPYYNAANVDFNNAQDVNYQKAAAPGMQSVDFAGAAAPGIGIMQQAGARDTAAAATPYANQGASYLTGAANGSALSSANPYIQASTQPTGLQAAAPYLGAASQTSASNVGAYMNPYNSAVTDQIAQLGARNLSENILPNISDNFIKSGQYGSGQMGTIGERAIRDTQSSILNAQTSALQQGYGQALSASQADLSRQAGLAGTAGGLGTAQQQALLGAGQASGSLSSSDLARLQASGVDLGQLGLGLSGAQATDAARQLAAGQGIGQLGLSAAQGQANYNLGQGQLGLGAASAQQSGLLQSGTAQMNLGTTGQNQSAKMAGLLEQVGATQQGQNQTNYNSLYNSQLAQYNLPWDTISKLSGVIQGLPVGGTTSGTTQTTTPGPSVAGQIGGIGLGVAGLANSGLLKAKGGAVKKPRQNASYGRVPKRGLAIADVAA